MLRRKYNLEVRVYFTGRIVRDKKTEWLQLGISDKLTMCKNSIWPGYLQKDGHFWSCQKLIEVVILNIWIFSMFPKAGRNFIFNKNVHFPWDFTFNRTFCGAMCMKYCQFRVLFNYTKNYAMRCVQDCVNFILQLSRIIHTIVP